MKNNRNQCLKERLFELLSFSIVAILFIYTNDRMGNDLSIGIITIIIGAAGFVVYLKEWISNGIVKASFFQFSFFRSWSFPWGHLVLSLLFDTYNVLYVDAKSNLNGLGESIFSMMEIKDAIFLLAGIPMLNLL
ncbi:hypothetical protein KEH51_05905 [[Brevibacterium] frigoritolerans]|uniref:Uncharacterized protein n=1 Tax=Peribacillus frigoritolerans TaxID=450367 RepID=A0A941FGF3_9BACI|nr:hypothetical protein [Peribacillus frigoritolerans]